MNDAGIITCTSSTGFSYFLDAATGKLVPSDSKTSASSKASDAPTKPPKLTISKVNNRGLFSLKFSDKMNLEAFLNTTNNDQPVKGRNATNDISERYKYLLSPKHLLIKIKSANTTLPKFYWYA